LFKRCAFWRFTQLLFSRFLSNPAARPPVICGCLALGFFFPSFSYFFWKAPSMEASFRLSTLRSLAVSKQAHYFSPLGKRDCGPPPSVLSCSEADSTFFFISSFSPRQCPVVGHFASRDISSVEALMVPPFCELRQVLYVISAFFEAGMKKPLNSPPSWSSKPFN